MKSSLSGWTATSGSGRRRLQSLTAHALAEIDLLAISTVSGNAPLSATFPNAHRMNGLMKTHYPVYKGADRPLLVEPQYAGRISRGKRSGRRGASSSRRRSHERYARVGRAVCLREAASGRASAHCRRSPHKRCHRADEIPGPQDASSYDSDHGRRSIRRQRNPRGRVQHLRGPRCGADRLQVRAFRLSCAGWM